MSTKTGRFDPTASFREESHGVLRSYDNKIDQQVCPRCGRARPKDWFVAISDECWQCRMRAVKTRNEVAKAG